LKEALPSDDDDVGDDDDIGDGDDDDSDYTIPFLARQ
jgi:hypothetical protein